MERCPICRARRQPDAVKSNCSRCGADLAPLREIQRQSAFWLQTAIQFILEEEWQQAKAASEKSLALNHSALGHSILAFIQQQSALNQPVERQIARQFYNLNL